jgi:protein involved in polysaccharide export with SLBB domain
MPLPWNEGAARRERASLWIGLVAALTLGAAALGCGTEHAFRWVQDLPVAPGDGAMIEPRDTILVSVKNQPALSGEFLVGDRGEYSQPTVGTISVGGKTTATVVAELQNSLTGVLVKPEVMVSIIKIAAVRVNVVGEVKAPGAYELTRSRGVTSALATAGWLTEFANRDRIFVIRSDGTAAQRIRFRAADLTAAEPHAIGFRLQDGDVVVVE